MTVEVEMVPLSSLRPGDGINVRSSSTKVADAELEASIRHSGLLQPLLVRQDPREPNAYQVVAGNRRLAALRKVHGKKGNPQIPVSYLKADDQEARELSLAENIRRAPLHPVDEYNAYASLVEGGATSADIATHFGVKEKWVKQRLQLAALAPELRNEWRAGKMTAEQAEVLSAAADHDLQRQAWKEASKVGDWARQPDNLRRRVRSAGVSQNEDTAKFIGLDVYRAAGGRMSDDLFADDQILRDRNILESLVEEKLLDACRGFVEQGWAWAQTEAQYGVQHWNVKTLDIVPWLTVAEAKVMAGKNWQAQKAAEAAAKARAMEDPAARTQSGVVVSVGHDGTLDAEYLVLAAEEADLEDGDQDDGHDKEGDGGGEATAVATGEPEDETKVNYSLRETLSEWLTVGLSRALALDADVALSALVASLTVTMRSYGSSPLRVSTGDAWRGVAPTRGEDGGRYILDWAVEFREATQASVVDRLGKLAQLVSGALDLRRLRYDQRDSYEDGRPEMIRALAAALSANEVQAEIAKAFDPETYFKKVPAAACIAAIVEMDGHESAMSKKKADLVAHASAKAKATGWLPVELRTLHYAPRLVAREQKEAAE